MESRAFIKAAAVLIEKIETARDSMSPGAERDEVRNGLQKEVGQLFGGLQNPTLPSAYRLRDVALRSGYAVDPKVQHRLAQFENLTA